VTNCKRIDWPETAVTFSPPAKGYDMGLKSIICNLIGVVPLDECEKQIALSFDSGRATGYNVGYHAGKMEAKLKFAVLPLPFTAEELGGRYYGEFITPAGFATEFGECTIPAPGVHGYEHRAFYVSRDQLESRNSDLTCHRHDKFEAPADSSKLVPVIVTVLR
jgi:hypothetical protein